MSFTKNLKAVFSSSVFKMFLKLLAGGAVYLAVPTAANINGTVGALSGVGAGTLIGVLMNQPLVALGSWLTMGVHAIYIYVNPVLERSVGRPIFGWSETGVSTTATTTTTGKPAVIKAGSQQTTQGLYDGYAQIQGLGELQPGATTLQLPDGRDIVGYQGSSLNDVPSVGNGRGTVTLNDLPALGSNNPSFVINI